MTLHHQEKGGGEPVRLDTLRRKRRLHLQAEVIRLHAEREEIDRQLYEAMDILDPAGKHHTVRRTLPKSGLKQAAPNVLLFKGGARV